MLMLYNTHVRVGQNYMTTQTEIIPYDKSLSVLCFLTKLGGLSFYLKLPVPIGSESAQKTDKQTKEAIQ